MSSTHPEHRRVLMLGTFGMQPKGTMSARAAGIGSILRSRGWTAEIITVPWDNPAHAGTTGELHGVPFRNTRSVRPHLWPLAVGEMVRHTQRLRPDLIHLFKPKGFGDLAARYLRRSGIPVIVDMDDWEGNRGWNDALAYSTVQRRLFDWQERSWPSQAAGVTVASRTLQQYAIELGAAPESVRYVPNQMTRARFESLANSPKPQSSVAEMLTKTSTPRILLYTRFVESDPGFSVEIIKRLISMFPGASLIVAGKSADGLAEQQLISDARKSGISNHITRLGWIDPGDLGWIASNCQAALVPFDDSLINRAKCSVKLLELIACGIPVVASSVGENREYLNRHGGGFLARPGDAGSHFDQLVQAIKCGATERSEVGDIEHSGLWEHQVDAIMNMYDRATGSRSPWRDSP